MLHRSATELNVRHSREPKPTVEVSGQSLSDAGLDVVDALFPTLRRFAKANPGELGTISLYGTMSVNFNEEGWSEFIIVDGSKTLLAAVAAAISSVPNAKSRYSDYVAPSLGMPLLHLEEGSCYQCLDAVTWGTPEETTQATEGRAPNDTPETPEVVLTDEEEASLEATGDEPEAANPQKRGRLRVARSDASVGTIRRTIEKMMGLPEGSVALCGPDKRPLRANATIRTLRNRWE